MATCSICGEDNPPAETICRRCKSTLVLAPLDEPAAPSPEERPPSAAADAEGLLDIGSLDVGDFRAEAAPLGGGQAPPTPAPPDEQSFAALAVPAEGSALGDDFLGDLDLPVGADGAPRSGPEAPTAGEGKSVTLEDLEPLLGLDDLELPTAPTAPARPALAAGPAVVGVVSSTPQPEEAAIIDDEPSAEVAAETRRKSTGTKQLEGPLPEPDRGASPTPAPAAPGFGGLIVEPDRGASPTPAPAMPEVEEVLSLPVVATGQQRSPSLEEVPRAGLGGQADLEAGRESRPSDPTGLELDIGSLHGDVESRARAREAESRRQGVRKKTRLGYRIQRPEVDPELRVAAPPMPRTPVLPELVPALVIAEGVVGNVRYGLKAPGVAKEQRQIVVTLASHLARAKRHEAETVSALGRAARVHGLYPDDAVDLVDAANHEDAGAGAKRQNAAEKEADQRLKDQEFRAISQHAAASLAALEERHAPLSAKLDEVNRRLEGSEALLSELRQGEREARVLVEREPTAEELGGDIELDGDRIVVKQRNLEEEVERRRLAHEEAVKELSAAATAVRALESQSAKLRAPLKQLEAEMTARRAEVRGARQQLDDAEAQARAAAVSKERRAAFASRSTSELDEEIGRMTLRVDEAHPALAELGGAVDKCHHRVVELERTLRQQQEELDRFDRDRARGGFRLLIGGSITLVVGVVVVGELLRRLILTVGG